MGQIASLFMSTPSSTAQDVSSPRTLESCTSKLLPRKAVLHCALLFDAFLASGPIKNSAIAVANAQSSYSTTLSYLQQQEKQLRISSLGPRPPLLPCPPLSEEPTGSPWTLSTCPLVPALDSFGTHKGPKVRPKGLNKLELYFSKNYLTLISYQAWSRRRSSIASKKCPSIESKSARPC